MGRLPLAAAAGCVALMAGGAAAQTFRSAVNLVVLQVAVTGPDGRVVTGLSSDEFTVQEDGAPRPIEQFSAERVPVSLGILVDTSTSMAGRRFADAGQALEKLLERFLESDQIFLAAFNSRFTVLAPWTNDRAALMRSLSGVRPAGGTFLYSSISAALPLLNQGANRKKALVIITDGDDNEKMAGLNGQLLDRAVRQAEQSEALIYAIGIGEAKPPIEEWYTLPPETRLRYFYDPPVDVGLLRRLTDPTGGYTQLASSTADLPATVISIADDLSAQYMIGFDSAYADGRLHTLNVTTRDPRYVVRARTGFASP